MRRGRTEARDEWRAKPAGFVSHGGVFGGLRAVEHLRQVFTHLHAVGARETVSFACAGARFDDEAGHRDSVGRDAAAKALLDQPVRWGRACATPRLCVRTGPDARNRAERHRCPPGHWSRCTRPPRVPSRSRPFHGRTVHRGTAVPQRPPPQTCGPRVRVPPVALPASACLHRPVCVGLSVAPSASPCAGRPTGRPRPAPAPRRAPAGPGSAGAA
ncbi:NADPH-dependent FMN reductase [Streptomyces sp. NPDC001834]|uniref:NADPH-dependent FMN reductase n=1 Tax=Streptomyces sp. NPDC001834 TaxID=3364616 RepID=UPI00369B1EBF